MAAATIGAGRVYDQPDPGEGPRHLVDRLWPRGIRKDDPRVGQWQPAVAPSNELRRWYNHQPELFEQFRRRYEAEIDADPAARAALEQLREQADAGPITLVTAAKDIEISHVAVLVELLRSPAA